MNRRELLVGTAAVAAAGVVGTSVVAVSTQTPSIQARSIPAIEHSVLAWKEYKVETLDIHSDGTVKFKYVGDRKVFSIDTASLPPEMAEEVMKSVMDFYRSAIVA